VRFFQCFVDNEVSYAVKLFCPNLWAVSCVLSDSSHSHGCFWQVFATTWNTLTVVQEIAFLAEIHSPTSVSKKFSRGLFVYMVENCFCYEGYLPLSLFTKSKLFPGFLQAKFCVVWRTWTTMAKFLNLYFKFMAVSRFSFAIVLAMINKVNDFRVLCESKVNSLVV